MRVLQQYAWPGNVRELEVVIRQGLLQATGPVLLPEFLPAFLRAAGPSPPPAAAAGLPGWEQFLHDRLRAGAQDLYPEALALMERDLLTRVLDHTDGNQLRAAKVLGISRLSLRRKLHALGIRIGHSVVRE